MTAKTSMLELLKKIHPLHLAPVSPDMELLEKILTKELPFRIHKYPSGEEHNGWIVPKSWSVKKATLKKNGQIIYDGTKHPLGVMGYSQSYKGKVDFNTLKKHLTWREDRPSDIGYHCDYYYKQWLSDWGLSIPYNLYKKLNRKSMYEVDIQTEFKNGKMKVFEFDIKGKSPQTIILNAHTCHAAQTNDGIAGVVVGIEIMRYIMTIKKPFYSYKLVLAPEHLGTVFYLKHTPQKKARHFKYCIFLEMLGNENRLILQKSFTGTSLIDRATIHLLRLERPDSEIRDFRKVVGNDETVWEAPGYEIPTISLSRWPYKEYHTSADNPTIISEKMLIDSVEVIKKILFIMENNFFMERNFKGLVALSNPKYDLYIKPGTDPSIKEKLPQDIPQWNYLMDCIPRYFNNNMSIIDICEKHQLPFERVYQYIKKFEAKGLLRLIRKQK